MSQVDFQEITLEKYRALELQMHREIMEICRKYITELGIVSVTGILDIVKREAIELDQATSKVIKAEEPELPGEFEEKKVEDSKSTQGFSFKDGF